MPRSLRRHRSAVSGAALGLCLALSGAAAAAEPPEMAFEIAPFGGYRVGGRFTDTTNNQSVDLSDHGSFALALDARADSMSQYELFYSRQSTTLTGAGFASLGAKVEYLHLGGTLTLDQQPRLQTYLAGGLGATRFSPDVAGGQEDTRFSMSLALGLRVPLATHFRLRFEARGYVTFMDTDTAIFCGSGQAGAICSIRASGSTLFQFEMLAGASFVF